jgi:hypothetical protein
MDRNRKILLVLVLLLCISSSVGAALMMGGEKESVVATKTAKIPVKAEAEATKTAKIPVKAEADPYRIETGIDYPGSDIFHYWPGGAIKATKDVCLDKCTELPNCKLVTFNNIHSLCWGKSAANNKRKHGDRNNYFKN